MVKEIGLDQLTHLLSRLSFISSHINWMNFWGHKLDLTTQKRSWFIGIHNKVETYIYRVAW